MEKKKDGGRKKGKKESERSRRNPLFFSFSVILARSAKHTPASHENKKANSQRVSYSYLCTSSLPLAFSPEVSYQAVDCKKGPVSYTHLTLPTKVVV